jgi:hypothetical protein
VKHKPAVGPLSDDEFRTAMDPLTSAIGRYARALSGLPQHNNNLPGVDSRAMAEIYAERDWRTDDWLEPARNAHAHAGFMIHFLADHLAAYAAVVQAATVGPRHAHLTLMRAVVEAAPIALWLTESTITLETRLRRDIAYRLNSANEQGRMKHLPEVAAAAVADRERCIAYATHHQWEMIGNSVGGEELPAAGKAFADMTFGPSNKGAGYTLWNLLSANTHATWYALAQGLQQHLTPNGPLDPLGGTVTLIVDGADLIRWGILCWQACALVTEQRMRLMDWKLSTDLAESARDMLALARAHGAMD